MEEQISLGERIVRTKFNPSNNSNVDRVKQQGAELINIADRAASLDPELASKAIAAQEIATMLLVKLLTT